MRRRLRPLSRMHQWNLYQNFDIHSNPCLTDHVCPKGRWNKIAEGACFLYQSCAATGCNDHSDTTSDECINIGTENEGCLYNVTKGNSSNSSNTTSCTADSDCVPEQCCHPTSCINKDYKTVCNLLCTQVLPGAHRLRRGNMRMQ